MSSASPPPPRSSTTPAGTTVFSQGAEPVGHLRVVRSGAVELAPGRARARPARRRRALRAGVDALGPAHRLHRARRVRTPSATASRPTSPAGCSAAPRRCSSSRARCWTAGASRGDADERAADDAAPAHQPVAALMRKALIVCAPQTSIRDAAQRMTDAGATLGRRRPRRLARDPHRSRPAHARGGRRAVLRRARLGGDDGAGLHGRGRPAGQRGVAGHARSRRPPLPRAVGDRRGARRRGGRRPRRRRDADVVSPAGGDRPRDDHGRARRRGARPAPDHRRAASRADGAAAPRRASTRWSSTRSSGG